MNTEEMTTGGMRASSDERRRLALASMAYNLDPKLNPQFNEIFHAETLQKINCTKERVKEQALEQIEISKAMDRDTEEKFGRSTEAN